MVFPKIFLDSYDCVTPAGHGVGPLLESLFSSRTHLSCVDTIPRGSLPDAVNASLAALQSERALRYQDKTSRIGIFLGRSLAAPFAEVRRESMGIILGSSRGPTETLESAWQTFAKGERLSSTTSPATTASGLTAAVARDLKMGGPSFSLSAACSTGLYAVLQGISTLISGMATDMLVGGIEAANTAFTFEMLRSAKVLNTFVGEDYPCRPGHPSRSGMVLSEGGALLSLSLHRGHNSCAEIIGWGSATEGGTLTGVSEDGKALTQALRRALQIAGVKPSKVSFIVGHGAGTQKGDNSELAAYRSVFGPLPPLVWHKWCSGHMLGASAALSVMLACEHFRRQLLPPHPYFPKTEPMHAPQALAAPQIALITSMGFGGSACALLVKTLL